VIVYRALWIEYMAVLIKYMAVLIEYMGVLTEYMAVSKRSGSFASVRGFFKKECGSLSVVYGAFWYRLG